MPKEEKTLEESKIDYKKINIALKVSRELLKCLNRSLFTLGYNFEKCDLANINITLDQKVESFKLTDFTETLKFEENNSLHLMYLLLENEGVVPPSFFE